MSGFTALNVEPEDTLEEEIDDTKEIQIEEAFKLYQNALKLHSQGPRFYDAADEAYKELFQSEVFKYPEVVTDYGHEQLDDLAPIPSALDDQADLPVLPANAADSAANSLPQLVYLSYKNRGQFVLDVARHNLENASQDRKAICLYYYKFCLLSLEDSANALERDDTDLDLWKKAARISDTLSSQRLVRFSLESVLAGDDESTEQAIDLSGLDEAFASGELSQVLELLQDDMSLLKAPKTQPSENLLSLLRKSNDPYPFLPPRQSHLEYLRDYQKPEAFPAHNVDLAPTAMTHIAFADALAQLLGVEDSADMQSNLGAFVNMSLPSTVEDEEKLTITEATDTNFVGGTSPNGVVEVPSEPLNADSTKDSTHSPASYHSAPDEIKPDPDVNDQQRSAQEQPPPESSHAIEDTEERTSQDQAQTEMRLPTRKRSSTAAGNEEPESRTKSKRLRARESLMEIAAQEEEAAQENDYYLREQLALIDHDDTACLKYVVKLLSMLNVSSTFETLQDGISTEEIATHRSGEENPIALLEDMKNALSAWAEEYSTAIISGHGSRDFVEKAGGLSLFQRHLKVNLPQGVSSLDLEKNEESLASFCQFLRQSGSTVVDVAILWLKQIFTTDTESYQTDSSYLRSAWPVEMRQKVMQILLQVDSNLHNQVMGQIRPMSASADIVNGLKLSGVPVSIGELMELVQTIFELYLDEYHSFTGPESQADEETLSEQMDRLQRWSYVATDAVRMYNETRSSDNLGDPLILRFLFAFTIFTGFVAGNDKTHVLSCLGNMKEILKEAGDPAIALPNNRAMPQVSIAAIDQEISRLSTLDFFNSVFDNEKDDPVATIIRIEPILEPDEGASDDAAEDNEDRMGRQQDQTTELRTFLDSGDASLKLFLWRRLQNAYAAITYTPKIVSCLLRSLEIILQEIQSDRHAALPSPERYREMLRWIRDADEVAAKVLSKVSDDTKAFESLDESHLRSSITAVVTLLEVLYEFVKFDDSIRLGQISQPTLRTNVAMKSFDKSRDRMRDAFVRGWTLLFHLIKEATVQFSEHFDRPVDQLSEYIRLVHNMLGHRQYCKNCNKLFVKLAKAELLGTHSDIDYSQDVAQILYDMYQIRLGVGFGDANHGCTADILGRDKDTAFNLVPIIMVYAQKLNMRDLVKSDLKATIDKIQQTLGQVKSSPPLTFNKKAISSYLKSQINPQEVYRSLKGIGDLMTKTVTGDYAKIAARGWYQMLGRMSLAKYKSIKRVNPTPTDDLDTAGTFLRLDLEHNISNWETWYRLAQVFDAKIEDNLIWNSLKLNDSRAEIATLERSSINAYTMAIAMAMRNADDSRETVQKISDMFSEFAFRLYASSRPPLSMEAFNTDKHMRHLSSSLDQSMSKAPFTQPFKLYAVWSFAAYLLQRKFASGQKEWFCHYTLGKCFWKMFQSSDNVKASKPITIEDVLEAFSDAVELVPKKEKSSDYILEPHYKIVSIIHKMVHRKLLSPIKGSEYLQVTQFARGVHLSEAEEGHEEGPDWETYILDILKKLGNADKSNWHHRITARAAHVIYDGGQDVAGALGAKHQFTQQIFTKTMTMQVWKPEHERPGRHYVYTGSYLAFFVHLLDQVNDRGSLEQLIRRIRRKTTDFLDHPKIWEETALTYVKLLRRVGKVPDGHERNLFDKISHEEFTKMSEKVEKWALDPENKAPFQDIVQDAIELKKLNNSLMKGPAIDDLIGDAYACMYEAFTSQLPPEEVAPPTKVAVPSGTFINMNTDVVPTGDDNLDRMRLNNLLLTQPDAPTTDRAPVVASMGLGVQTPPVATPPVEPVRIPTPSKPGRTKTITRREVQRKAEACLIKQAPIKTPTLLKRPFIDLPGRRDSAISTQQEDTDVEKVNLDEDVPDNSRFSSRRPSMSQRDSAEPEEAENEGENDNNDNEDKGGEADDESELSELDDDADDESEKQGPTRVSKTPQRLGRKRKAEDDEADDTRNNSENEEDDEDGDEDGENEGDEAEQESEGEKDEMDVDEPEDTGVEIQDSQESFKSSDQAKKA